MRIVAFLVLVFCTNSWAKYLVGEGEFLTIESDKPSFVKKQLIFSAKKNILNNYLVSLDLSPQEFWQGFDSKIEERLKNKISWFDEKINEMQKSDNFDELLNYQVKKRELILEEKARYLERSRVFSSYSIKNRSQSISNPSLKFIKLKVKISKSRLKSLFFSLTKEELNKTYEKLYISVDFKDYSDLRKKNQEVSYQSDLMEELKIALINKWRGFFEKEYTELIKEFVFVTAEESSDLDQKLLLSPVFTAKDDVFIRPKITELDGDNTTDENSEIINPVDQKSEINNQESDVDQSISSSGELYLKLTFSFYRSYFSEGQQKGSYQFKGGLALYDLAGAEAVFFDDFKIQEGDLFLTSANSFYSSLATKIYNLPLKILRKSKKKLSRFPGVNNNKLVKINSPQNINDVFSLSDFLSISGATHNFNLSNYIVLKDAVYFDLHFNGGDDEVINKFIQWENKKIGNNLVMSTLVENSNIEIMMKNETSEIPGGEINENQQSTEI